MLFQTTCSCSLKPHCLAQTAHFYLENKVVKHGTQHQGTKLNEPRVKSLSSLWRAKRKATGPRGGVGHWSVNQCRGRVQALYIRPKSDHHSGVDIPAPVCPAISLLLGNSCCPRCVLLAGGTATGLVLRELCTPDPAEWFRCDTGFHLGHRWEMLREAREVAQVHEKWTQCSDGAARAHASSGLRWVIPGGSVCY